MSRRILLGLATLISHCFLASNARICENVHVVHSNEKLENALRGCTTVVGYVKLTLFEEENVTQVAFPELTTISGYLLLFRVNGLASVGKLFPNLNVIGGDRLLMDYALVIYNLPHLQEIGLRNLRRIARGGVRIDLCPKLCYVNTIDWKNIGSSLHYVLKNTGVCAGCPTHCNGCWNHNDCQQLNVKSSEKECDTSTGTGFANGGICVTHCPTDKFTHLPSRACVTKGECSRIGNGGWFTVNSECVKNCPDGYRHVSKNHCDFCGGNCTKVCGGSQILSIQAADRYRQCTHVDGSLEIRVSCRDRELEYGLGNIRVIDGYLKVFESSGLVSLSFLKKLKSVKGNTLYRQRYSLAVFDNDNLQHLWDKSKVILDKGIVLFHHNPKLCRSEIDELSFSAVNKSDICPVSNGDEVICAIIGLDVTVLVWENRATIAWDSIADALRYIVYYREDFWQSTFAMDFDIDSQGWFSVYTTKNRTTITQLNPYTTYAFYIQLSTLTSYSAGRSVTYRFQTKPGEPSPPRSLKVDHVGPNEIQLFWHSPQYPGGIITNYEVSQSLLVDEFPNYEIGNGTILDLSNILRSLNKTWVKLDNTTLTYTFTNLHSYGMYELHLRVCNDLPSCSAEIVTYQRTKPSLSADDIHSDVATVIVNHTVNLKWESPQNPNSHIISYLIRYRNVDLEFSATAVERITSREYEQSKGHLLTDLTSGNYLVTVTAISLFGPGKPTQAKAFKIASACYEYPEMKTEYLIAAGFILGMALAFLTYCYFRRLPPAKALPEPLTRGDLEFLKEEDRAKTYGVIKNGFIKSQNRPCTVKFGPKYVSPLQTLEFVREVNRMKFARNCHHVADFIGLIFPEDPALVVMELMAWGDLKSYLREFEVTEAQAIRMSAEIADGMLYLESLHLTHPDLAARNCMVTAGCTVKLVIFGINRDVYLEDYCNYRSRGSIPIRWMAPESITDGVITFNSNVWSYGVVLWEIVTGAQRPYNVLSDEDVAKFVIGRRTLERPQNCGNFLYHIMVNCWQWEPNFRIGFFKVLQLLAPHLRQDFRLVSFYDSEDEVQYQNANKDKLILKNKNLSVRWKKKDQVVTLDTIRESAQEDINLPGAD